MKHTNKQSNKQKGQRTIKKAHTNIQSNKRSIKQTTKQAHHQSNQTNNKERKRKNPKEETLYKKLATPDRPPPAAAMLRGAKKIRIIPAKDPNRESF